MSASVATFHAGGEQWWTPLLPRREDRFMSVQLAAPDLVGMAFHDARDLVAEMGIALANTDPDGPPIGSLAWPGLFFIATQLPSPGDVLSAGDSIRVTVVKDEDGAAGVPSRLIPTPPSLSAKAALDEREERHEAD
jgi:hypothetical protein